MAAQSQIPNTVAIHASKLSLLLEIYQKEPTKELDRSDYGTGVDPHVLLRLSWSADLGSDELRAVLHAPASCAGQGSLFFAQCTLLRKVRGSGLTCGELEIEQSNRRISIFDERVSPVTER